MIQLAMQQRHRGERRGSASRTPLHASAAEPACLNQGAQMKPTTMMATQAMSVSAVQETPPLAQKILKLAVLVWRASVVAGSAPTMTKRTRRH